MKQKLLLLFVLFLASASYAGKNKCTRSLEGENVSESAKDHYTESWKIYKAHSEVFKDDLAYYTNFAKGFKTLELFAGYGRVTNHLIAAGVDVTAVDLNANFLTQINSDKKHQGDVTKVELGEKFDRVFAAYNSFCLLTETEQIKAFFRNLSRHMNIGALASLNYYSTDHWPDAVAYDFDFAGEKISYKPSWDLSQIDQRVGRWVDTYVLPNGKSLTHEYSTRVYLSEDDLLPLLAGSGLELVKTVREFGLNKDQVMEPGWIDYVLKKTAEPN